MAEMVRLVSAYNIEHAGRCPSIARPTDLSDAASPGIFASSMLVDFVPEGPGCSLRRFPGLGIKQLYPQQCTVGF